MSMASGKTQVSVDAQTQPILVDQSEHGRQRYPRDGASIYDSMHRGVLLQKIISLQCVIHVLRKVKGIKIGKAQSNEMLYSILQT